MSAAVESYRLDYGSYPWPKPGEVTATTEIRNPDVYRALAGGKNDYLGEVPRRQLKNGVLIDTWGRPLIFRVNPESKSAVIWSCGENGRDETNTGPSPDPEKLPKTYYYFGGGKTGDDITNL